MSTYILWDIDGTLVYNTPAGNAMYLDAVEHVTGVRPMIQVENPHGMTEAQFLIEVLDANDLDTTRIGDVLFDLDVLSRDQHERGHVRDACVGVDAAMEAVAQHGWTNALLTGNGPNRARYKLLAAGIDPELFDWDHSYFGHESPTRHHLTAGARRALAGQGAFIIGDTPNDGLAADSAGIPFIAVATGFYSADELRHTSAIVVIDDLQSGAAAVLEAIERSIASARDLTPVPLDDVSASLPPTVAMPIVDSASRGRTADDVEEIAPPADEPDDSELASEGDMTDTRDIPIINPDAASDASGPIVEMELEDFGENPDIETSDADILEGTGELAGDNRLPEASEPPRTT